MRDCCRPIWTESVTVRSKKCTVARNEFTGRFELFEENLKNILGHISPRAQKFVLPIISQRTNAEELLKDYYNDEFAELVSEKFQKDFLEFGYDAEKIT